MFPDPSIINNANELHRRLFCEYYDFIKFSVVVL